MIGLAEIFLLMDWLPADVVDRIGNARICRQYFIQIRIKFDVCIGLERVLCQIVAQI